MALRRRVVAAPERAVDGRCDSSRMAVLTDETGLFDPARLLCHYTTADTAFRYILRERTLRMNTYKRMRDPFENRSPFLAVPGLNPESRFEQYERGRIQSLLGGARGRKRLLSLTEGDERRDGESERDLPFRCPWGRARMWEQYADDHAGVCLVFDRDSLLTSVRRFLKEDFWDGPVTYTIQGVNGAPATTNVSLADLDLPPEAVDDYLREHYQDFFFLKTEDWATEFEYRIVSYRDWGSSDDNPPPGPDIEFGDSLLGVFVGANFPEWQVAGARAVTEGVSAHFRHMTWNSGRPHPDLYPGVW